MELSGGKILDENLVQSAFHITTQGETQMQTQEADDLSL